MLPLNRALCSGMALLALVIVLQSCASQTFDIVVPKIDRGNGWSVDAAGYLVYRESLIGPRLTMFFSPSLRSGRPESPLLIRLTLLSGFESTISVDVSRVILTIRHTNYSANFVSCDDSPLNIKDKIITSRVLSSGRHELCVRLLFEAPQPEDWSDMSLQMDGLSKDGKTLTVPIIKFYKTKKTAPGSFV